MRGEGDADFYYAAIGIIPLERIILAIDLVKGALGGAVEFEFHYIYILGHYKHHINTAVGCPPFGSYVEPHKSE